MCDRGDRKAAIRAERLELIQRVLEFQREFEMLHGRWPTVEEVRQAIDGA